MRPWRLLMSLAVALCMAGIADAGPFGVFKRHSVRNVATVTSHAVHGAVSGAVNGVTNGIAQAKSQQQANEGRMRHVGGSFGAGRYEGVGMSSVSADHAIRSCCYWGQRTPVEIGVARGRNGYFYATVLYK